MKLRAFTLHPTLGRPSCSSRRKTSRQGGSSSFRKKSRADLRHAQADALDSPGSGVLGGRKGRVALEIVRMLWKNSPRLWGETHPFTPTPPDKFLCQNKAASPYGQENLLDMNSILFFLCVGNAGPCRTPEQELFGNADAPDPPRSEQFIILNLGVMLTLHFGEADHRGQREALVAQRSTTDAKNRGAPTSRAVRSLSQRLKPRRHSASDPCEHASAALGLVSSRRVTGHSR